MDKPNPTVRLATYNIRKCVGLDRQRNPGRVLDVINKLDADVVALQEVDKRLGNRPTALPLRMIEAHSDFEPVGHTVNDVSLGWHGNAILVRKGSKVAKAERIDLPGLEPRGAVMAEVSQGNRTIRVVATHLGLTRKMRRAQLGTIDRYLKSQSALPTAILGDFNEWSRRRGLEALEQRYTVHAPGRSFHAARPLAALDRIAVNSTVELQDAGVQETPLSQIASDHLPVWADLAVS